MKEIFMVAARVFFASFVFFGLWEIKSAIKMKTPAKKGKATASGSWLKPMNNKAIYAENAKPLTEWIICDEMLKQAHLLVGGTTGAGKSTLAHSIIWSLASAPPALASFYGIDLKQVELRRWSSLPHCQGIATTPAEALECLDVVNNLLDIRLKVMVEEGLSEYNGGDVYLIVDELAELLSVNRKTVVDKLSRIMRLGRAAHVHVLGFTQAPNRAKGGGLDPMLCQNFTAAVALRCRSAIESRQIIGIAGAESLPLHGEGIFWSGNGIKRIEVPMTPESELRQRVLDWTK